jgi:hypothetical protein
LTPVERATLLLREVFDYEYSEIASILEQSEANCRQILRRARQHIKEERTRFAASQEHREELLRRFSEGRIVFVSSDLHDPAATRMGKLMPPKYGPVEDLARHRLPS